MSLTPPARPARDSGKQKLALVVLAVVLLGTVFVLPSLVPEPQLTESQAEEEMARPSGAAAVKPSTAAEQTRYRQDAQSLLAEIIVRRDRLIAQNVAAWAGPGFEQAVKQVEAGDESYSYGKYKDSLSSYRKALELLTGLEESGREQLAAALHDGLAAVESLNQPVAQTASTLTGKIAPEDAEVQALVQRVAVLPEVAVQIGLGDEARERGELDPARSAYQRAVDLDPAHRRAADSLAAVRTGITEAEFRRHMSRGLAALESQDYEGARAAFRQAEAVRPGEAAVKQALQQLENQAGMKEVSSRLGEAAALESREAWQAAVDLYREILAEDASIVDARVRLVTAEVRAGLDSRLQAVIDDPLSISGPKEFDAAQTLLADARGIASPGAKLGRQIDTLASVLAAATSPVEVMFQSDNQTHVTLFRVADLGRFEHTAVTLRPGRYVAAGTRSGFRDVRVEFTVTGQPLAQPIVVRCEEAI